MQSYIFFANYVLFLPENVYLRSQMKITKNKFLLGFGIVVLILALIKAIFPEVSTPRNEQALVAESPQPDEDVSQAVATPSPVVKKPVKKHRIRGVQNYKATFPDSQAVQIVAAERWGVRPVKNREDAEKRKKELVFVGANPFCTVYVPRGSTGWGVTIPGTWNGMRIEYFAFQPLSDGATATEVAVALSGVADTNLTVNISDVTNYNAFCVWAQSVKDVGGSAPVGEMVVKRSANAWLSYALGADRLITEEIHVFVDALELVIRHGE